MDNLVLGFSNANLNSAIPAVFGWITDVLAIFGNAPAVYFVGVALVGAVAGIARKFVPMRRR